MLSLSVSFTTSVTLGGGLLAEVPVPGDYFSFTKIVVALVGFGMLARCMTWVDSDLARVHGPRTAVHYIGT